MVGIHSPEFDFEKDRKQVEAAVNRYGLDHPIMMDNDHAFWRALGNRYWPSFYLVDREGRLVHYVLGETHPGSPDAKAVEAKIEALLAAS